MNVASNFLNSKPGQVAIAGGLLLIAGYLAYRHFAGALANYTKGSPYQDAGAVGVLGKSVDDVSGGLFSSVGGAIGRTLYDWTHNDAAIDDTVHILSVTFPDGMRRSIADSRVTNALFDYEGVRYRLLKDASGKLHAVVQ